MVTVIAVLLIGGTFKLKKQVQDLQENTRNTYDKLNEMNRYVDDRVKDLDTRIDHETEAIYRTLDSRFDKLENKLTTKK
jgi:cell division septum initiation protein DivIVA